MRKLIIAAVISVTALTGQAFAKQAGAVSAPVATQVGSRVSGQSADANQLMGMGLGLIPIIVVAAGVIAVVANSNDKKYTICSSSGC